jgi:hypothetical protein
LKDRNGYPIGAVLTAISLGQQPDGIVDLSRALSSGAITVGADLFWWLIRGKIDPMEEMGDRP